MSQKQYEVHFRNGRSVVVNDALALAGVVFREMPQRVTVWDRETGEALEELDGRLRPVWSAGATPLVEVEENLLGGLLLTTGAAHVTLTWAETVTLLMVVVARANPGWRGLANGELKVCASAEVVSLSLNGAQDTVFLDAPSGRALERRLRHLVDGNAEAARLLLAAQTPQGSWTHKLASPFSRPQPRNSTLGAGQYSRPERTRRGNRR
ncbi:hypothetical protein [Deinococcus budaensis]|uniref:Uncharacterized protein n=1 Tax=Deinococcus budaensis TaxID=1665626 RepID=A0A7W8GEL2_9DEIO|nr:hypothetical protein [Deinococcus budaensis]MBB5234207.1 hypothetical protein [Deinococcus budaensis]